LSFSISILFILGFLLVVLIKPYYRRDRLETIDTIASTIEKLLIKDDVTSKDLDSTSKLVVGNNVCMIIYNENGEQLYSSDSLGELCMLDKDVLIDDMSINIIESPKQIINVIKEKSPYTIGFNSPVLNKEMVLYGSVIKSTLANYYMIINTPTEPVESYVDFIMNQYSYMAIIVVVISLIVSFVLSTRISRPIENMKQEADKLAQGNYDTQFQTKSFTEINELASTLDDATKKLSKVNDLRKDLLANVSHDIKTPLTMIKAYAEMIKDISGDDPEKRNEHLDVIIKETDYLNRLVSDMSELSKLQSGNIEINKTNLDLKRAVLDVEDLLDQLLVEKDIEIVNELDESMVYADEIKLCQVIYNFLSNAIKHSENGSKIEIKLIDSEAEVRFSIIDHGEGIKAEVLPYIWDRYYKVDKNFNRSVNSSGLGLAIAKAILEAHGASYGVDSKYGVGSTFYFVLSKNYDEDEQIS